jgi:Xylanase inhibitor C-terminal
MPSACVLVSADILEQLPTLTFRLGAGTGSEFNLELRPEDYLIESVNHGVSLRCVGFMALEGMAPGTDIIFGNTIMLRYLTVYDRANKRMGFAASSATCGAPPDCASYTQCIECAAEDQCAFNFRSRQCVAASEAGVNLLSFPVCRGSGCRCGIGQSFLAYGVATGFLSCLAFVGFLIVLVMGCGALRRKDQRSQFVVGDEEEAESRATEPAPLVDNEK